MGEDALTHPPTARSRAEQEASMVDTATDARTGPEAPAGALTAEGFARVTDAILAAVGTVIDGKPDAVRSSLVCLLAEGHLLIEDVPGVGKTMLARALATSVDATVRRIQFTPDLLPGDVTGVSVFNPVDREFEFKPGAIFANIVIADEINRSSPKTQSALLEAMEERQVTVDGRTHYVPEPFLVVATQNPLEMEGTYALPEAQRDRFMMRISMGYPDARSEALMLRQRDTANPLDQLAPVVSADQVSELIAMGARRARRTADRGLRGRPRPGHAHPLRPATRREPPRDAAARARREGVGGARRARVRHPRRHHRAPRAGVRPPPHPDARRGRRTRRQRGRRDHDHPRAHRGERAGADRLPSVSRR